MSVNYHEKLGVNEVINASGKMTILGVSISSEKIVEAQNYAATHFFEMDSLSLACSKQIAALLKAEDALVLSSSASALVLSSAAFISQGEKYNPEKTYQKQTILLPKGHNVDFGAPVSMMVAFGGAKVKEVGYANACSGTHVEEQIDESVAAMLYVDSHHCVQKSHLSVKQAIAVTHKNGIPIIVDAAAEEDLFSYIEMGADVVIYSGGKGINGPSSSAIVVGKQKYIQWIRLQQKGIGRAMKVSKDTLLGTVAALEEFLEKGLESKESQISRLTPFITQLNEIAGISAEIVQDGSGRSIYRAKVKVETKDAGQVVLELREKSPVVYTREYQTNIGIIEFDIRAVNEKEMNTIVEKLKIIMA